MTKTSKILEFHLFADDTNLFLSDKSIIALESKLNNELNLISEWLRANKLSLNIDKTNHVVFHSPQRKLHYNMNISKSYKQIKHENQVKYLGLSIDCHLSWKPHVHELAKKISRGVGLLSKIKRYVNLNILRQLYHCLAHSEPLFKQLGILNLKGSVSYHNLLFVYQYHYDILPESFNVYFCEVASRHNYSTRLASKQSYCIGAPRTNYGKFNVRFSAIKHWNILDEETKLLPFNSFKTQVKKNILKFIPSLVDFEPETRFCLHLLFFSFSFSFLFGSLFSISSSFVPDIIAFLLTCQPCYHTTSQCTYLAI